MKKLFMLILFVSITSFTFCKDSYLFKINGQSKVSISYDNENFKPLNINDEIFEGAIIQTGFKCEAILKLYNSTIIVSPLTRVAISELKIEKDKIITDLNLEAGALRNDVKSTKNLANDYKVRTSVVTCSVRGTQFYVNADGTVEVTEGKVEVVDKINGDVRLLRKGNSYYPIEKKEKEETKGVTGFNDTAENASYQKSTYTSNVSIGLE